VITGHPAGKHKKASRASSEDSPALPIPPKSIQFLDLPRHANLSEMPRIFEKKEKGSNSLPSSSRMVVQGDDSLTLTLQKTLSACEFQIVDRRSVIAVFHHRCCFFNSSNEEQYHGV